MGTTLAARGVKPTTFSGKPHSTATAMLHQPGEDTAGAVRFYQSRRGIAASALIASRLAVLWPRLGDLCVLGLGYASPYLPLWRAEAYRCIDATSSHHGAPRFGACSVEALRLPFPDLSFDRILVIHGVEPSGHDERLLREVWRVLKDDGRILVVAPNRTGLWAHLDSTPFGQGQPYSQGQIGRLLANSMFRPERGDCALFMPPALVHAGPFWESVGRAVLSKFAGVTLTEAVKDVYAAVPTHAAQRRRVMAAEAA